MLSNSDSKIAGSAVAPATAARSAAKTREVLERDADKLVTLDLVARDQAMAKDALAKRDEFTPKMKTTVTTMFVRGGSVPVGEFHFASPFLCLIG